MPLGGRHYLRARDHLGALVCHRGPQEDLLHIRRTEPGRDSQGCKAQPAASGQDHARERARPLLLQMSRLQAFRMCAAVALAIVGAVVPAAGSASSLPSAERVVGNAPIEPAYDDFDGTITYLLTPNRLAPLNPSNPLQGLNHNAVAPLYLIVYPPGTPGIFNCMGVPGNCPDHDATIAGVATSVRPAVYGTDPAAVPGHDHLVGLPHTGDFNFAWHVY